MLFEIASILLKKFCEILVFGIVGHFGCHWKEQSHRLQQPERLLRVQLVASQAETASLLRVQLVALASHGPNDIRTQGQLFDLCDAKMLAVHQIHVPFDLVARCFHQSIGQMLCSILL